MAIIALILGILGLTVFCWLGPVLGAGWAGALIAGSAAGGQMEIPVWPVWALGLGIGAGVPLVAVVLGLVGMRREGNRPAVAITGIVLGAVDILAAVIISGVFAAGFSIAHHAKSETDKARQQSLQEHEELRGQLEQQPEELERPL